MPLSGDKDIKAQLQAMENLISSSQETIKVLLGVIQELEKGEAQREGWVGTSYSPDFYACYHLYKHAAPRMRAFQNVQQILSLHIFFCPGP